uniref:Selenoprotein P n=1 Tax=Oncorhynchus tshawytscha TaxID=74940 RepID=A0A8C8LSL9_ONCTS
FCRSSVCLWLCNILSKITTSIPIIEGEGTRCKQPPGWSIGEVEPMKEVLGQVTVVALLQARLVPFWNLSHFPTCSGVLDGLRLKLEGQGLENVTYMVVNHQGEQAQRLHTLLRQKLSENITLYKQQPKQEDVWQTLAGEKDDFLIYDRCGRLTYHISLPYSILGTPYVENAIKETYCTRVCGDCTYEVHTHTHTHTGRVSECNRTVEAKPEGEEKPVTGRETTHGGHGHHHHGHGHNGNRHGHNGNRHGHNHHGERGMGHGRDHGAEQQHQHDSEGLQHGQAHGQLHVGQEHMGQQAVQLGQMPQEGQRGHIMQNP